MPDGVQSPSRLASECRQLRLKDAAVGQVLRIGEHAGRTVARPAPASISVVRSSCCSSRLIENSTSFSSRHRRA